MGTNYQPLVQDAVLCDGSVAGPAAPSGIVFSPSVLLAAPQVVPSVATVMVAYALAFDDAPLSVPLNEDVLLLLAVPPVS